FARTSYRRFTRDDEEMREHLQSVVDAEETRSQLELAVTNTTEEIPAAPPPDEDDDETVVEPHPPTTPDGPVPWRERERRRIKPDWLDDPWGNVCWWLGYAANVCAFHAIRAPWYFLLCLGRAPRGIWRLYSDLRRFGRP